MDREGLVKAPLEGNGEAAVALNPPGMWAGVLVPIFWPDSAMAIGDDYRLDGYSAFWYNIPGARLPPEIASHHARGSEPMSRIDAALGVLDRMRYPFDLAFEHTSRSLVVAVRPAAREPGSSFESRLWRVGVDGGTRQISHGPGSDAMPRCAPGDGRLAFASDRALPGRMALHIMAADGLPQPLGEVAGSVEDLQWGRDGQALFVLAADRGLDVAATDGAVRLWWGDPPDPEVSRPGEARRRLFRVDAADGATVEVGPEALSIWQFALVDDLRAVALVSADPSERGWYDAELALLDLTRRSARILYRSRWQLQGPAVHPRGQRVAVLEGWSSDRGLVAGTIRLVELSTGESRELAADQLSDLSFVAWRDARSLWCAGWGAMGSLHGVVQLDGEVAWLERDDAVVGSSSFLAQVVPSPDQSLLASVRETVGAPPEVVLRKAPGRPWRALTTFNQGHAYPDYPAVREIGWRGADGLSLEGLVLLPPGQDLPAAMIVSVHGGPTWSVKHAFDPGHALPLAAAGYAVFLPNYRGSVGWGQEFTRKNLADPGGAEFEDILRGLDRCIAEGIADPARLGITGVSYGGYMTAWAVATSTRFAAAVMVSGISDLLSCEYACNHAFGATMMGGRVTDEAARRLFVERSPLVHVAGAVTPTLILHGREDLCTPLGQAEEFHRALAHHGVATELVVYPREGHGFQERGHRHDAWRRAIAWFDRHLQGNR